MWDETPFVDALFESLHPSVKAEEEAARRHIFVIVLGHGERRPLFVREGLASIQERPAGFVYDRPTGLLFIPSFADHERCAGCLMNLRSLRGPVDWTQAAYDGSLPDGRAADRYLEEGMGFVANSPRLYAPGEWPMKVGTDVSLTAQEKTWFRGMNIQRD